MSQSCTAAFRAISTALCSHTALLPGYYAAGNPRATRAPAAPAGWQPAGVKSATAPQLCGAVRPRHGLLTPRHPPSCGARAEPRAGGRGLVCGQVWATGRWALRRFKEALTCLHNCRNGALVAHSPRARRAARRGRAGGADKGCSGRSGIPFSGP